MYKSSSGFSPAQRQVAIQRLTALWAFMESGLGGILHALQVPFTGLVLGGMAVLLISLITFFSAEQQQRVLHSMIIVLIVKAMVSPHTPPPAYIAVSFQGLLGYVLFRLMGLNLFSILILSVISMLESAVQQLLVLTLFFGKSFWQAADKLSDFITRQLGVDPINGSNWIIGIYLAVYLIGGLLVTWMAHKTIRNIFSEDRFIPTPSSPAASLDITEKTRKRTGLWIFIIVLVSLSIILYVFAADSRTGWLAILKALCWTSAAILLWYGVISPLFTRFIRRILKDKEGRYSEELASTLAFFPELKQYAAIAWQQTSRYTGGKRLSRFCSAMVQWSLTGLSAEPASNKPA